MNDRREFLSSLLAGGAGIALAGLPGSSLASAADVARWCVAAYDDPWLQVPAILARITAPVFAKRDFSITTFGAVGNARADCTEAFARAIAACSKAGGGRVVVPEGEFLTGAIHLKSNVNLHVTRNATIRFDRDPRKYLPMVFTRWE